jgi:hypothetical protein
MKKFGNEKNFKTHVFSHMEISFSEITQFLARKKKEKAGLEMEMITHPDTRCWASKLTMLFSFEWQVPCLWQQLFCWLPCLHNGVT